MFVRFTEHIERTDSEKQQAGSRMHILLFDKLYTGLFIILSLPFYVNSNLLLLDIQCYVYQMEYMLDIPWLDYISSAGPLIQWLQLLAWEVGDCGFLPSGIKISK